MFDFADLENWFTYHSPTPEQVVRYQKIRAAGKAFALAALNVSHNEVGHRGPLANARSEFEQALKEHCPESVEMLEALRQSADGFNLSHLGKTPWPALAAIRCAVMWANASIACN